jgi:integrase
MPVCPKRVLKAGTKMKTMKFTQANVNAYKPPAGDTDHMVHDEGLPGFGLRVQAGGSKVYIVRYRLGDKQGRVSLGNADKVTLEAARKAARRLFEQVANKVDPAKVRAKAVANTSANIVSLLPRFLSYMTSKGRRASYVSWNEFCLATHWKPLHKFSLNDIDRSMVADRLAVLKTTSGETSSDRCRAVLSKFFNWAIGEGLADNNPVQGTNKVLEGNSNKRDRVLTHAELKNLWTALNGDDYGKICKLLILTGQRLDEIGSLQWSELKLDKKIIELPKERTKNGLPHDVPLSDPAVAILKTMKRDGDRKFVFGRGNSETKGFNGWSKSKERLTKLSKVENWTHHDFRRTLSTIMHQELDIRTEHVEAVLNHVSGAKAGVAGVYNKAKYNPQKRDALEKYANFVLANAA